MMTKPDKATRFTATHEWALKQNDLICIGITNHAQQALGDIVFVELPTVGSQLKAGQEFGVIESVKAASDLYSPLSGEVIAINDALKTSPETINQDPYEKGWLVKIKPSNPTEWDGLLDENAYEAKIKESA